ncbi:hypothetical protein B0H13DRAFT_1888545 [Mycena leptocephala]|nr:hypothetical protein B0H13DRAFT_1888545 [Mycena leptocephala]
MAREDDPRQTYNGAASQGNVAERLVQAATRATKESGIQRCSELVWSESISLSNQGRYLLDLCGLSGGKCDHGIMTTQAEAHNLKSEYVEARDINNRLLHEAPKHQDPYHRTFAYIAQIDVSVAAPIQNIQKNMETARKQFNNMGLAMELTMCETVLADLYLREGNILVAQIALEGFTLMDVHRSRAECVLQLGDISKAHGDLLKAVELELWQTARPLFERSSQAKQVENIDKRLTSVGDNVLEQHRKNLACIAEYNPPSGAAENLEGDLSDIEDPEVTA